MLTVFTTCKPFEGHVGTIQRNAIRSWLQLRPECEIILLGNASGTSDLAKNLGIRHEPRVKHNEFGRALVNSLFETAQKATGSDYMCFVNCDIILMDDLVHTLQQSSSRWRRFLVTGGRWEVDVDRALEFRRGWQERLREYALTHGKLRYPDAIDYFVFPRHMFVDIPPFAIGNPKWDNWLLYRARSAGAVVIDATQAVMAIHQNHDYSHHPEGHIGVSEGVEAKRNLELAGGSPYIFTLHDATHLATRKGLRPARSWTHLRRRVKTFPILHPYFPGLRTMKSVRTRLRDFSG